MGIIVEAEIPATDFELGRILTLTRGGTISIETMGSTGEGAVPFFSVRSAVRDDFEDAVRDHPSVSSLELVSSNDESSLYAIEWQVSRDLLFEGLGATNAQVLDATGAANNWRFELRFPSHDAFDEFQQFCADAHISLAVSHIYNPTKPDTGPWYGLSEPQRETLIRAVEGGYYSIPRKLSTQDLAEEFGISDQAVTERLRRAIVTLVENTLVESETKESAATED
jgi:hypothetical protein